MIPAIQVSLIHKVFKAVEREGPLGNVLLGLHDVFTVNSLSFGKGICFLGALAVYNPAMCQQGHTDAKM